MFITILISVLVGFVLPMLIALAAIKYGDNKMTKPILIKDRNQSDLDLSKIKFMQETDFWKNYDKR